MFISYQLTYLEYLWYSRSGIVVVSPSHFDNLVDSLGECTCFSFLEICLGSLIGSLIVNRFNVCWTRLCGGLCERQGTGVSDADWMAGVKLPDGLRRVKASLYPALWEFSVIPSGIQWVVGQDIQLYYYECMHCTTQPEVWKFGRASDIGFSSCAAPIYYHVSQYFNNQQPEVWKLIWNWA